MKLPGFLHARLPDWFGIDLRSLALFRAGLGGVLLVFCLNSFGDLLAFYTDWGMVPRDWAMVVSGAWRVCLHCANGESWFAAFLIAVESLSALALMLGYRTRLASVLSFILHGSLLNRNALPTIGGDTLMMCLLFWAMFLPLAARWSVDAALATNEPPRKNLHLSYASAGLIIQVLSVYFFSAILKNAPVWWPDGTAVYYTMQLDRYASPLGQQLLAFPLLMQALTYFVYFLELLGPLLAFSPWFQRPLRFAVMLCLMGMHTGFIFFMEIGHFPYVSLASNTVLLGGWFWDWAARRRDHGRSIRIFYDRDCGFCLKSCLLFQTFLVLPRAEIRPAQDFERSRALMDANYSWVVIDHDDVAHTKWPAFTALLRHSLLFSWLYRLAAARLWVRPGNAVYDFVGRHRSRFAAVSARLLPQREVQFETGRAAQALALVALITLFVWNLGTIKVVPERTLELLAPPLRILRIDQLWNMFAPMPLRRDGWMVIPGKLEDGSQVNVLQPEQPLSYDKPYQLSQTHEDIRWHTLRGRMWEREYRYGRVFFARYLCRNWNLNALPGQRLVSLKLEYVVEETLPDYQTPQLERQVLWTHACISKSEEPAIEKEPIEAD